MLTIIKRSGEKEPFDPEKSKRSLAIASDGINRPIGESDLKMLTEELCGMLDGKTEVTSRQLNTMLTGLLYVWGFRDVAECYTKHTGNMWQA